AYIDFDALRRAGILQRLEGSKATEDPDYQAFVRKTNFDYKQDLDAAMVAFTPTGRYLLVKGHFDWKTLRSYAKGEGGECVVSLCTLKGSAADRNISFFPVQSNLMGMAVSEEDTAARHLMNPDPAPDPELPNAPVWLSIPSSVLKAREKM